MTSRKSPTTQSRRLSKRFVVVRFALPRGGAGSLYERSYAGAAEIGRRPQRDVAMALAGAFEKPLRIGQRCATGDSQLHAALTQDQRADESLIAGRVPVSDVRLRVVHALLNTRKYLINEGARGRRQALTVRRIP